MTDIPPPPPSDSESKKPGLFNRATQAAKAGVEKTQQAKAERDASKGLQAEQQAAVLAAQRQPYIDAGHRFMEYRVVFIRETLVGDKINTSKLQGTLNEWAQQGWHLKTITSASVGGRIGPGGVDGLVVTFERTVLH